MILLTSDLIIREQPDPTDVKRYRQLLRDVQVPPPIKVMEYHPDATTGAPRWFLLDGHHRVAAIRAEGYRYVEAKVVSFASLVT